MTADKIESVTAHEVINSNETGNLYKEDVEDLRKGYLEVKVQALELARKFAGL